MRGASTLALAIPLAAIAAVACNAILGIEEGSPKPPPEDAAPPSDAATEPETTAGSSRCTVDADCIAPNGCYRGRCDTVLGACAYSFCETRDKACSAGTCDLATLTCGNDRDYGFQTTSYPLGVALGCKASPQACVAAAFPFLFVGTTDDTSAFLVDDLLAASPKRIAVGGVTFHPAQVLASGRRVWLLGDVVGTAGAPPYQLQVAWIDVPSDPAAPSLSATSATLVYPFTSYAAFPAPDGGLFLGENDPAAGFPIATLTPPLPATPTLAVVNAPDAGPPPQASIPMYRLASAPAASTIVASSGTRLVMHRFSAQLVNLITSPATAAVALGPDLALAPILPAYVPPHFGQGPDGTVFFAGPINADPPPPDCNCTSHERVEWVFPNALATAVDVNQVADPESYSSAQVGGGACHQCNPSYVTLPAFASWIDAKTVIVAAPASDPDRTLTATRVIGRDPPSAPAKRRVKTAATDVPQGNFAVDHVGLVSAGGFGYEILADSEGNKVTLSIFDPRCDVK